MKSSRSALGGSAAQKAQGKTPDRMFVREIGLQQLFDLADMEYIIPVYLPALLAVSICYKTISVNIQLSKDTIQV